MFAVVFTNFFFEVECFWDRMIYFGVVAIALQPPNPDLLGLATPSIRFVYRGVVDYRENIVCNSF